MKVTVTDVHPSPKGLVLGCVVSGPGGAWVRFCLTAVPYEDIPAEAIRAWTIKGTDLESDSLWEQLALELD